MQSACARRQGSDLEGVENLSLSTPTSFKPIQMGGAHQALMGFADGIQQQMLSGGIKLRQHVIQQQQRRFAVKLRHQIQLCQLQAQYKTSLLAG